MDLAAIIARIVDEMRNAPDRGTVARYIPSLAGVDPAQFGIAIVTADGETITGGDADTGFSIQSISKVFSLTLALGKVGGSAVGARRPRAFGQRLQLDRPIGGRERYPAQPVHQCRCDRAGRRQSRRPHAARGDRRARPVRSLHRIRRRHRDRRDSRPFRGADRRTQPRARPFHEVLRHDPACAGSRARHLFPRLFDRNELPPTCAGRALPDVRRASPRGRSRWSRPSARAASSR